MNYYIRVSYNKILSGGSDGLIKQYHCIDKQWVVSNVILDRKKQDYSDFIENKINHLSYNQSRNLIFACYSDGYICVWCEISGNMIHKFHSSWNIGIYIYIYEIPLDMIKFLFKKNNYIISVKKMKFIALYFPCVYV